MTQTSLRGHLGHTVGKYLPDLIFGATDGIVTTLAVITGVEGASLSPAVVLILGFANLIADGFSMGASNVLARRSEAHTPTPPALSTVAVHGLATFIGFVVAGLVPLLAYLLPGLDAARFKAATVLALLTLFVVGAFRARFTGRRWLTSGLEMLIIGTLAAIAAYAVGALGAMILGHAAM
jgi:VIT1/CCC1 family predicted Fe2+/Mn2+ transporter